MSKAQQLSTGPAKGMRDFLPQQTELRDWLTNQILSTYRSFGFERIETPVCEDIRRLRHSDGGENLQMLFEIRRAASCVGFAAAGVLCALTAIFAPSETIRARKPWANFARVLSLRC